MDGERERVCLGERLGEERGNHSHVARKINLIMNKNSYIKFKRHLCLGFWTYLVAVEKKTHYFEVSCCLFTPTNSKFLVLFDLTRLRVPRSKLFDACISGVVFEEPHYPSVLWSI